MKRFVLLIICICFCCFLHSQNVIQKIDIDTTKNQLSEKLLFYDIPPNAKMRYQQRINYPVKWLEMNFDTLLWDTTNGILTLISPKFPDIDTLRLSFLLEKEDGFVHQKWGNAVLLCENQEHEIVKQKITEQILNVQKRPTQIAMLADYYYIQIAAVTGKQPLSAIALQFHLQNDDVLIERVRGKYYCYLIGHFQTREEAQNKLKYYSTYAKDAFIVKEN